MLTHLEQWAANAAAPGEQLGVRFLAKGSHLSRRQFLLEPRFKPTTLGYKSHALSIRPRRVSEWIVPELSYPCLCAWTCNFHYIAKYLLKLQTYLLSSNCFISDLYVVLLSRCCKLLIYACSCLSYFFLVKQINPHQHKISSLESAVEILHAKQFISVTIVVN